MRSGSGALSTRGTNLIAGIFGNGLGLVKVLGVLGGLRCLG